MKKNTTNLIIAAVILILIGLAGYWYANRDQSSADLLTSTTASSSNSVDGDLLIALNELKHINLDSSIFTSPVWLSLSDFSQPIPAQSAGRPNPFAPLDASVLGATSTSQVSQ